MYRRSSFTYTATVPELKSGFAGTTVATDRVKAALVAGTGLLALVNICVTPTVAIKGSRRYKRWMKIADVPVQLRPSAVLLKPRPQRITHRYEPMVFSQSCPLWHALPSSEHSSMSVRGEVMGVFTDTELVVRAAMTPLWGLVVYTLAGPAVSRDRQATRTGAVIGAHGVMTSMRAGVTNLTFVLVCRTQRDAFSRTLIRKGLTL